jgi:hypothetical protein
MQGNLERREYVPTEVDLKGPVIECSGSVDSIDLDRCDMLHCMIMLVAGGDRGSVHVTGSWITITTTAT